jgi:hypothetical protein
MLAHSVQMFKLHPIRWKHRPVSGRLIVYSVSSEQDKVGRAVCDGVVKYSGRAIA